MAGEVNTLGVIAVALFIIIPGTGLPVVALGLCRALTLSPAPLQWRSSSSFTSSPRLRATSPAGSARSTTTTPTSAATRRPRCVRAPVETQHIWRLRHACCPAQPPAWSDSHRAVPPDTSCARPVTQSLSPTQNQWGVAPPSRPRTSRLRLGAAGQSTACSLTPSWCALGPRVRTHTGRSPPVKPFAVV